MVDPRRVFGDRAEDLAAEYLMGKSFKILERQYKTPIGEIDLICSFGNEVIFVEVKARRTKTHGYPEESITPKKLHHIFGVAQQYIVSENFTDRPWRIDVIAIEYDKEPPKITHIESIDMPEGFW